jgi:predicted CoA-binding protein
MVNKAAIKEFLSTRILALIGASQEKNKFGNLAYRELKSRNYQIFPVNPNIETIEGDHCYSSINELPESVNRALIITPPTETEKLVKEIALTRIEYVWMQPGSESESAILFCKENNIHLVHSECILMFASPVTSYHLIHRWYKGLTNKLPK